VDRRIGGTSNVDAFPSSFCPHSGFVRLALNEYGVATRLIEERTWERRRDFLAINPAGTPVLVDEGLRRSLGAGSSRNISTSFAATFERRLLPRQAGRGSRCAG
jgi:glutathione S-transferase